MEIDSRVYDDALASPDDNKRPLSPVTAPDEIKPVQLIVVEKKSRRIISWQGLQGNTLRIQLSDTLTGNSGYNGQIMSFDEFKKVMRDNFRAIPKCTIPGSIDLSTGIVLRTPLARELEIVGFQQLFDQFVEKWQINQIVLKRTKILKNFQLYEPEDYKQDTALRNLLDLIESADSRDETLPPNLSSLFDSQ
jgi:hypothetical protein